MTTGSLARAALPALALLAAARPASAQECPETVPEDPRQRRTLAKDWFSRAEAAETGGNEVAAIKAYQCSLKMVPHAFTAFNLARLAEKTGDLELAVDSYGTYLKLAPEAQDKTEVEAKITALTARISAARDAQRKARDEATAAAQPEPDPTVPQRTLSSEPMRGASTPPDEPGGAGEGSSTLRTAGWIVAGGGAALLAGGLVLNLGSRSNMEDCRRLAKAGQLESAQSACDSARPKAYASYALMAVGPLAIAAGLFMALKLGAPGNDTEVAVAPLDDGAAVSARLRF
jgi:tetratricopeptide (TPR) repeat protein